MEKLSAMATSTGAGVSETPKESPPKPRPRKTRKRKQNPVVTPAVEVDTEEMGKVMTNIMGTEGEFPEGPTQAREKRFKKLANSKTAKELPLGLDNTEGDTPVDHRAGEILTDHMLGVMTETDTQNVVKSLVTNRIQEQGASRYRKKAARVGTGKDTRREKRRREELEEAELEDQRTGRIKYTVDELMDQAGEVQSKHIVEEKRPERRNDLEKLPRRTLKEYKARDDNEAWLLQSLKAIDKKELSVVRQLPERNVNAALLRAMKDQIPFFETMLRKHVESNKKVPVPEVIDWDYAEQYLRQSIKERGERDCVNGRTQTCVSLRDFGFVCREFLKPSQARLFDNHRATNPDTCRESLPKTQRMCLACHMAVVTLQYHLRVSKKNHRDPTTEMEDGKSELLDDNDPLTDIQFDVHHPGQFDIWCCIGIGDTEWHGVPGAFVAWDPNNYAPEKVDLVTLSRECEVTQDRDARLKRAVMRQKRLRGQSEGLVDDMYRAADGKLYRKGMTADTPKAVYHTPTGSMIPGRVSMEYGNVDPMSGRGRPENQRTIQRLRQKESLLFRPGAMPARIDQNTNISTRSTRTGRQ